MSFRLSPLAALAASLLSLAACQTPTPAQRRLLDSLVGRPPVEVVRNFGVPTRTYSTDGHSFLAYVEDESSYFPGSGGLGYGGFGYGGYGGFGGFGGFGGYDGFGYGGFGGFPPSYYSASCQTLFEVVGDKVASWSRRGNGC